ncbi:class I adenylate-forming enzyme family protein [Aeromicrobium sp. P5_D10]
MDLPYLPWQQPARRHGRPCLADDSSDLTYGQVEQRVEAIAEQLAARGFGSGDVLAIMLPNRVELILAVFAAWRLGGCATPINPVFTASEADHQINDSGAVLVINAGSDAPTAGRPHVSVDELAKTTTTAAPPPVRLGPDDLALLIYTSGSTGSPKGVMLSHGNLEAMTSSMGAHLQISADDHCLLVLPLFHVNAIVVSTLTPLVAGARMTIVGSFSPSTFFGHVERLRPTYFSAVPTIYALLAALPEDVRPDTSSLRFVVCGAAPVSAELLQRCQDRFGFVMVEGYGLTEGTCASACNPVDGVRKLGTVGPALPGQQIRVVDAAGDDVPTGTSGEVLISGPTVMRGYLGKADATAETIVDGWLHTGDVGRLDDDGYLSIVDRVKDMIIRGGENIYPKEIETVLAQVDDVLEVAVVGRPDPILGEVPVAYVTLYPASTVTADALTQHCRTHLTRVKVPESITIVDVLPKNPVGKIDKPTLRRALHPQPA